MRALIVVATLALASPTRAEIDCDKAVQTAAFKREVASRCGYFVNTGDLEERAPGVHSPDDARGAASGRVHRLQHLRRHAARYGLQRACPTVLHDMRGGFVAD